MLITDTLTALCLILSVLLALFGVAGFLGNWTSVPDHDSLRFVQAAAKTGRYCAVAALALHTFGHALPTAPAPLWFTVGALAATTYLTRTSNRIVPTGAAA